MTVIDTLRNATRDELMSVLNDQHAAKFDIVVPANQLQYRQGRLVLAGLGEVEMTMDGVTAHDIELESTEHFERQAATRLGIPQGFWAKHRPEHIGQLDEMVNYWLAQQDRNVMVRSFRSGNGGTARALVSDRYLIVDHLDFMVAVRKGIEASGYTVQVDDLNLSDTKMRVDFVCPDVTAVAGDLLRGYTSPFSGNTGNDNPIVMAGFRATNSEVGAGRFRLDPWAKFLVCDNGMTITKFAQDLAITRTHRGAQQLEGAVAASARTQAKTLELLTEQVRDSVEAFLNPEWFQGKVTEIEAKGTTPIEPGQVMQVITTVANRLNYTDDERDLILTDFIAGGQATTGGVMQAVTATAQRLLDPERAAHLQETALDALLLA